MKSWKKSKTVMFNGLRALMDSGIIVMLIAVDWETAGLSPQVAVWVVTGLSLFDKLANLRLRFVTTKAIK